MRKIVLALFLFVAFITTASASTVTIQAENRFSLQPVTNFSALVNSATTSTTSGYLTLSLGAGTYLVSVSADGYYATSKYIDVTGDQNETFDLTPTSPYYAPHYVRFIVQSINGTRYPNVSVMVYDDFNASALYFGQTGSDGAIGFSLIQDRRYSINFSSTELSWSKNISMYPVDEVYPIYIEESVGFTTGTVNTTLTNYTTNYTNKSWSIQNLTSANLNSQIGLGTLGQGVVAATINWFVVGAAGPGGGIAAIVILAILGVVSWVMVLFCGMTIISLYVLKYIS